MAYLCGMPHLMSCIKFVQIALCAYFTGKKMHLSDILTHLGEDRKQYFNAVAPPIIQTSNFTFNDLADFRQAFTDELEHHVYSRGNNPTVEMLRQKLAALEGAEDALVLGSGSAAVANAVIANVSAGDHIVCVDAPYSWTKILMSKFLPRFGVTCTFVDGRDVANIEAALQPNTKLLYLESPNSLTFEIQDLAACANLAKSRGIVTCIDNSYCSPIFQQPIKYGIDLVVHSGTKYLNGHSDVVVGVICGSKTMIKKIFDTEFMTLGGIISAHEAGLVLRGLRTLDLRVRRSHESTMKIAQFLENHPKVDRVLYPWLPSFPQHDLAKQQMSGAGGLCSVYFKAASQERMEAFIQRLGRFLLAVSWGGYESLISPTVAFYDIPGRENPPLPWNLVRFYIGLEDPDWLIEDLEQALEVI